MRAFFALTFLLLFSAGAAAQSCQALRGQLSAAQAGKPNQAVVASLNKRARAFGCNQRSRVGQHRACAGIQSQLRQAKSGNVNRNRVRRLQRAINQHCTDRRTARRAQKKNRVNRETKGGRRNIFSALFGRRDRTDVYVEDNARRERGRQGRVERVSLDPKRTRTGARGDGRTLATRSAGRVKGSSRVGSSRTMCVRLCDGFYFPINNRSHSDNYYDELAMCVGRCPGSDVSLYVHYQGEAVEQMRSAMTGEAYVNLPTAFKYRKSLSPSCGCANGTQIARGAGGIQSAQNGAQGTATDAAKKGTPWQRLSAVYDGTGKPLTVSRTTYGSKVSTERLATGKPAGATPAAVATTDPRTLPSPRTIPAPPASEPAVAAVEFDPADDTVRGVGPQFFSEAVAAFAAEKAGSVTRERVLRSTPTAITVTPLRRDTPAASTGSEQPSPTAGNPPAPVNEAAMLPAPLPHGQGSGG
ncbi:MAG: DUF2865 domain-containing protein [Pseudomonadota bacterium]